MVTISPLTPHSFGTFQWCLHPNQISLSPSKTSLFLRKDISSAVLGFFYSGFYFIRISLNKRRIGTAALIRGRRLLTFLSEIRAYSRAALNRGGRLFG